METISQYAQTYRVFFRLIPIIIATILWYSIAYKMYPIIKDNALNENLERMKRSFGKSAGKTLFFFFKGVVPFAFGAVLYSSLYYIEDPIKFTGELVHSFQEKQNSVDKEEALKPLSFDGKYVFFGFLILGITLSPFAVREQLSSKWEINILKDLNSTNGENGPYMFKRYRSNLQTLYGGGLQYYHRFHLLRSMYYLINKRNMDARNALFETMDCCENHPEYKYVAQKYLISILQNSDQQEQAQEISLQLQDVNSLNLELVKPYIDQDKLQFEVQKADV
ncbi:MAG: hypothetical protein KC646_11010 [Candidatus Cloacimonetes bacterium]|nr:hypothetical protein [Candidatus Cloacimonadota bacterium]